MPPTKGRRSSSSAAESNATFTLLELGKDPLLHIASLLHPNRLLALTETCHALKKIVKDEATMLANAISWRENCGGEVADVEENMRNLSNIDARLAFLNAQLHLNLMDFMQGPIEPHAARDFAQDYLETIRARADSENIPDEIILHRLKYLFPTLKEMEPDVHEEYLEKVRKGRLKMPWVQFAPKPKAVALKETSKISASPVEADFTMTLTTPGGTIFTLSGRVGGQINPDEVERCFTAEHPDGGAIDHECDEYKAFEKEMIEKHDVAFRSGSERDICSGRWAEFATGSAVVLTMVPGPDYIAPMTANGYPYPSFEW